MNTALRVLMVEDSEDDCELLLRTLRRGGYSPSFERVDNAAAMNAALGAQTWDVVLSDFSMPQFNALTALELLQQSGLDLPFIIVSGSIGEETAVAAMKAGVHDYIMKDNLARMISVIEREVREAKMRSERRQIEAERAELFIREQAARAEAEQANRAKDEFLSILSHELRTPLTPLLGWLDLLRSEKVDPETTIHALEAIDRSARLQARLVEDLLDVTTISQGKLVLQLRPVNLAPLVEAEVEAIRPAAAAEGIQLQPHMERIAQTVSGDPHRLQQIVGNLLSNALKFTPRGGRVEVGLRQVDSFAEIRVSDTGEGIAQEFLPHIFERFRQRDSSSTRSHGGLGLGLTIVQHMVDAHGGTVQAQSPGEGQGATFTVRLPLAFIPASAKLKLVDIAAASRSST